MLYLPTIISVLEVLIVIIPVLLTVAFITIAKRKTNKAYMNDARIDAIKIEIQNNTDQWMKAVK